PLPTHREVFGLAAAAGRAAGVALHAGAVADQGEIPAAAAGVAFIAFHPRFCRALGLELARLAGLAGGLFRPLAQLDAQRIDQVADRVAARLRQYAGADLGERVDHPGVVRGEEFLDRLLRLVGVEMGVLGMLVELARRTAADHRDGARDASAHEARRDHALDLFGRAIVALVGAHADVLVAFRLDV